MLQRPRRIRSNKAIRNLTRENNISIDDLIYPVFVKEDLNELESINSMPGIYRNTIESLLFEMDELTRRGLKAVAIFPVIPQSQKSLDAKEAYNPEGFTQRVIRELKIRFPELLVITDVALDPYTIHGHDGLIKEGKILNDETVEVLQKMALAQAEAGSDIVAPSDMMDGRVEAIRNILEENNFKDTMIMSYTAKYASCLYGPFRDALGSLGSQENSSSNLLTKEIVAPKNKLSYQMTPANTKEALKELELDIAEGADIVMVKPASWYLDIIRDFKENTNLPVAAYQVSGEYSMIHAAAQAGYIDLDRAILESLVSIKRAGANMILSYFAKDYILKTT